MICLITLLILLPVLFIIILILRFSGEGEIFYGQDRVGRNGKKFKLLKFATMQKNSPNIGAGEITLMDDPRVLPFGKILRKTKINEIPQLLNVLKGDMSIVGPRPMVPDTFLKYPEDSREKISKVLPGLTGIGSIFFRNEELYLSKKNNPRKFYDNYIIPYKSQLEVWFVKNNCIKLYFKIIFITAWVILFPNSKILGGFFRDVPCPPKYLEL